MEISKSFLERMLEETIQEFTQRIINVDNRVVLEYIGEEEFNKSMSTNAIIKKLVEVGAINSTEEFGGFLFVSRKDINPKLKEVGRPYAITINFNKAKRYLEKYDKDYVQRIIKHMFSHELTHVYEERIIEKYPKLWERLKAEAGELSDEVLAVAMAERISPMEDCEGGS